MRLPRPFERWNRARKERRVERLTARAADLDEEVTHDLLLLHRRGFVSARGTGQSITRVSGVIENLVRKRLRVVVTAGTYFVSSGAHQNMVTTEECSFTLDPCSVQHLSIAAACINAGRPIPGEHDRFKGVARVSESVARFLEAAGHEDPMVIQAGVWTLTDGLTRDGVISRLISRDGRGARWHPITQRHCDRAVRILEELGIRHRLWHSEVPYEKKTVELGGGTYSGELRHGRRHGRGNQSWKSGASYEGDWRDHEFHGEGTFVWPNGYRYVGRFEDGSEVGGWYCFPDGTRSWCIRNAAGNLEPIAPPGSPTFTLEGAVKWPGEESSKPAGERVDPEEQRIRRIVESTNLSRKTVEAILAAAGDDGDLLSRKLEEAARSGGDGPS